MLDQHVSVVTIWLYIIATGSSVQPSYFDIDFAALMELDWLSLNCLFVNQLDDTNDNDKFIRETQHSLINIKTSAYMFDGCIPNAAHRLMLEIKRVLHLYVIHVITTCSHLTRPQHLASCYNLAALNLACLHSKHLTQS